MSVSLDKKKAVQIIKGMSQDAQNLLRDFVILLSGHKTIKKAWKMLLSSEAGIREEVMSFLAEAWRCD